jgi:hypothetical protein
MIALNWGDKIFFNGTHYRIVEVDEGKKNLALADRDGDIYWFSDEELAGVVADQEIKQQKEINL